MERTRPVGTGVDVVGTTPLTTTLTTCKNCRLAGTILERVTGIEPAFSAWEASNCADPCCCLAGLFDSNQWTLVVSCNLRATNESGPLAELRRWSTSGSIAPWQGSVTAMGSARFPCSQRRLSVHSDWRFRARLGNMSRLRIGNAWGAAAGWLHAVECARSSCRGAMKAGCRIGGLSARS
jgi:hypothetical protein